jgi:hypothetical protein
VGGDHVLGRLSVVVSALLAGVSPGRVCEVVDLKESATEAGEAGREILGFSLSVALFSAGTETPAGTVSTVAMTAMLVEERRREG